MDLRRRVPTGIAYGAVFLIAPLVRLPVFPVLVAVVAGLAALELGRLYERDRGRADPATAALLAGAFAGSHLIASVFTAFPLVMGATLLVTLAVLGAVARRSHGIARSVGGTYAAAVYVGWLFGFLIDLWSAGAAFNAHGWDARVPAWLYLAILPTWAADVAAFLVGRTMGTRQLAPRLSAGKTWEGTVGGFAAAALAALGVGALFGLPRVPVAVVVLALGPAALAGDLLESYFKRRVGAKDSGSALPGHGGVLDRIDSLIAVAPLVAIALYLASGLG